MSKEPAEREGKRQMKTKEIIVKQNEENPVPVEIMAEAIIAISQGVKKLRAGPLNERALLLLITNAAPMAGKSLYSRTPVSQKHVKAVLAGIEQLEREYLKPGKK